jgi:UDPglucose 6-dehydrogenase
MRGLVTSATVAHLGHDVCCADIVSEKVAMLSRGEIPMVELGRSSRSSGMPAAGRPAGSWRTAEGAAWTSH